MKLLKKMCYYLTPMPFRHKPNWRKPPAPFSLIVTLVSLRGLFPYRFESRPASPGPNESVRGAVVPLPLCFEPKLRLSSKTVNYHHGLHLHLQKPLGFLLSKGACRLMLLQQSRGVENYLVGSGTETDALSSYPIALKLSGSAARGAIGGH